MAIATGTKLGPYQVVGHLGTGGMGEVYRAQDTRLGRDVALKVLPPHIFDREDHLARFEREARIVSGLNHPHILTIHEIGRVQLPGHFEETHYIVTEFVDGMTMREALSGPRDQKRMLEYMAQVADALRKAHSVGVVHRDLKPENIMFTNDGYAKVLDFGLAKIYDSDRGKGSNPTFQTQQGIAMGTIGYMAPEQIRGKPVDHRADIFAFGCVLFEMLAGELPFAGEDLVSTLHKITSGKVPPLPVTIDPALRQIVRRCLEQNPAARYQNMREVSDELRAAAVRLDRPISERAPRARSRAASASTGRLRIIAVMPFANNSADPESEYLSDGITESIIYTLSQVRKRLRVVARNTVFAYKGKQITAEQVANDLGATAMVTGRVQRIGSMIVVAADLVSTSDGSQLWGERFQRPFSDIFEVQEQIAAAISDQLKLRLSMQERKKLAQRPTRRSEAYELYLKGRYHLNRRTTESLRHAVSAFDEAVAVDPKYALAWAGLAEVHALRRARPTDRPEELTALAEDAARKAIQLDPTLAEPHATLGFLAYLHRWDWEGAEREYRTAISLNSECATAHHWYAQMLARTGQFDEALLESRMAVDIEPLTLIFNLTYAGILYGAGRYEEAQAVCQKIIELEPRFHFVHWMTGRLLIARGLLDDAIDLLRKSLDDYGRHHEFLGTLGYAYGRKGMRTEAMSILREIESGGGDPLRIAEVYLGLGEYEYALHFIEKLFRARGDLGLVLVTPEFAPIRKDPRFEALLERVGYPKHRPSTYARTSPNRLSAL